MRSFLIAFALVCVANATSAADPKTGEVRVGQLMSQILSSEASGQAVDRRGAINGTAGSTADHWHAGQLLIDGQWVPFEGIPELDKSRLIEEYQTLRGTSSLNEQRHRELARWCKSHNLAAQERAHWHALLSTRADDAEARAALAHQWIGDRWYTPEDMKAADEAARQLEAEWRRWMPVMRKLATEIASSNNKAKRQALERLAAIDDPSAVSSLEVTACQLPADQAIPFVQAIASQRSQEACLALTRVSFAFPVDPRGDHAISALRSYPKEFYVPELLGTLSTPIESATQTLFNPKGELLIRRAIFRETKDEKQQLRLNRLVRAAQVSAGYDIALLRSNTLALVPPGSGGLSPVGYLSDDPKEDQIAGAKNALEDQRQFDSQLASTNLQVARSATSAYVVLEKATGEANERTPEAWWDWWRKYNDRTALDKTTRSYDVFKTDLPRTFVSTARLLMQHSCLVGGTLVHTAEGPRAIESIRIGDVVVSQDVETGELALKPVVQTTVGPPTMTLTITTDSGKIQATAGHRWFVAGKGWLMTRDLASGMLLHNATGTTRIVDVTEDSQKHETYNLIVDGFHTYFVGPQRVLSFDISEPRPTLRAVPGYGQIARN